MDSASDQHAAPMLGGYVFHAFADPAAGMVLLPRHVARTLSGTGPAGGGASPASSGGDPPSAAAQPAFAATSGKGAFGADALDKDVQAYWRRRAGRCPGPNEHAVFDPYEAARFHRAMKRFHRDERGRLESIYSHLESAGHIRKVALPDMARLDRLARTQPHMSGVVQFVQSHISVAMRSERAQSLPPMLIVGEPGIGKTHFGQELAAALSAPLRIQRMDSDITNAFLLGSDRKWGNSQHGCLFEAVVLGKVSNPVVVLDDLDKGTRREDRPQQALYSLLESSAGQVRDISLDFEFDASLVTWIATVNDPSRLDSPLRSRFREFHIGVPDACQSLTIAEEVMRRAIADLGVPGFGHGNRRLRRYVAHLPARTIRQLTQDAVARAIAAGANELSEQHLEPCLLEPWGVRLAAERLH